MTLDADDVDVYVATEWGGNALGGVLTGPEPGWGQSGSAVTESHPLAGEVIHVSNMNYQGMLLNTVDISGKQSMHIDLWSETSGTVNVALVNTANPGGTLETAFGLDIDATVGWNSFDVDLEAYGLVADGSIDQMVFSTTADAPVTDFYIDNLYFGNQTPTVGTPSAVDQPDAVHLTYETDSPDSFAPNGFEDGVASIVTDAPGTGSSAVHFFKGTDVKTWAGVTLAEEAQGVQLITADHPTVTLHVYVAEAGIPMMMQLKDTQANLQAEVSVDTAKAGWQTMVYDFAAFVDSGLNYNQMSMFPDFVQPTDADQDFYFDDIRFLDAVAGTTDPVV